MLDIGENGDEGGVVFLNTVCVRYEVKKARLMFADGYDLFTDPETSMYPSAVAYGKLLKDSVWM